MEKLQKQLGNSCFWPSCYKQIYVLNYSWHFEQWFHNHQQLDPEFTWAGQEL